MAETIDTSLVNLPPTILGGETEREVLREVVASGARRLGDDWMRPDGEIPWKHETYLKRFALDNPELPYDYILVDEAQDLEPLTVGLLGIQPAQVIAVGDPNQAIYAWRGAIDALDMFGGTRTSLTQSFRFGAAIADEANEWLDRLGSDIRVRGLAGKDSSVWRSEREREAILTRTNGGAMMGVMESQKKHKRVGVAGERKAKELTDLAQAAYDLQTIGKTRHRELDVFTSWNDVLGYVEDERQGTDLAALVNVVETYGARQVIDVLSHTVPPAEADQVISTVHVSKGLENRIRLHRCSITQTKGV